MSLSVVIPNFNGSRTLRQTLQSMVDQLPIETEVVMVDDCSTDQSVELVERDFSNVRVHKNSSNLGAASARNIGIELTRGEWILFVDADVILSPGCIDSLIAASQKADLVFPCIRYPNGKVMYPIGHMQESYLMISPVFLIRRSSLGFLKSPAFDDTYKVYCEDTDFFLRAYLAGLVSIYQSAAEAIHEIDLLPRNRESRYFLEIRNALYGAIKFGGIRDIDRFDHAFKIENILKVIVCGIFNFNLFDLQARGYSKPPTPWRGLRLLLGKHQILTDRGTIVLVRLIAMAMLWNLIHFPQAVGARSTVVRRNVRSPRVQW
jgi:glycosyltransferase involved in cell wall biosynthesis